VTGTSATSEAVQGDDVTRTTTAESVIGEPG
jgi:hypothetical protein